MTRIGRRELVLCAALVTVFEATSFAQTSLTLTWDPVPEPDVAGYEILYTDTSTSQQTLVSVGVATTKTVSNLQPGRWYSFAVRAFNAFGQRGEYSTPVPAFTTALTGMASSQAFPIQAGTPVSWTGTPAPGSPALEYQFWRLFQGTWSIARPYGPTNTYTWTPGAADAGTNAFQVWARQIGATTAYEAYAATGLFSISLPPLSVSALVANGQSPFSTGAQATWTAVVMPAQPSLAVEYSFWRLNRATGTWTNVRSYAPQSTFSWTPDWRDDGSYALQVWARFVGSPQPYNTWLGQDFAVVRGVGTLSSNVLFPAPPSTPITWAANAGTDTPALQYQFWLYSESSGWVLGKAYDSTPTFSWTPAAGDLGTHAVQAWVRSSGSSAPYDAWRGTGPFDITRQPPEIIGITLDTVPVVGTATTIRGSARGGTQGPLQYRFWLFDESTGSWTSLCAYSASASCVWTPAHTGGYTMQLWVRSAGSTATYEAWLGTPRVLVNR